MTFLARISAELLRHKVKFAVAGAYALNLHGVVRGTIDIDFVLDFESGNFAAAERAFLEAGFLSRQPVSAKDVFMFRKEYIANKNMVAWSFWNPTNPVEILDVIITHDLKKMRIMHVDVEGIRLPVVSKKDLIAMKKKSGRPQDLEDIRALESI